MKLKELKEKVDEAIEQFGGEIECDIDYKDNWQLENPNNILMDAISDRLSFTVYNY